MVYITTGISAASSTDIELHTDMESAGVTATGHISVAGGGAGGVERSIDTARWSWWGWAKRRLQLHPSLTTWKLHQSHGILATISSWHRQVLRFDSQSTQKKKQKKKKKKSPTWNENKSVKKKSKNHQRWKETMSRVLVNRTNCSSRTTGHMLLVFYLIKAEPVFLKRPWCVWICWFVRLC